MSHSPSLKSKSHDYHLSLTSINSIREGTDNSPQTPSFFSITSDTKTIHKKSLEESDPAKEFVDSLNKCILKNEPHEFKKIIANLDDYFLNIFPFESVRGEKN